MAFKGRIEAVCPKGCEPFEAEAWSFIGGRKDEALRDALIARECNLLLCPQCGEAFFPDAPVVYFDPDAELLAFIFPPAYEERESYWREKMARDFKAMRQVLGENAGLGIEPRIFFGFDGIARVLEEDDYYGEEREVMEFVARDLGLNVYAVSPSYAREKRLPRALPYAPGPGGASLESVAKGLETLLRANDRLELCRAYLEALRGGAEKSLPPAPAPRAR